MERKQCAHRFSTVDYEWAGANILFVKTSGFDAEQEKEFEGVFKFVGGLPYGDLIHADKSFLSDTCREKLREYLIKRYENKEFN